MENMDQPQEIIDYVSKYAESPKGFLVLSGKNGTGKTYIAKAICRKLNKLGYAHEIIYTTQADLNMKWIKVFNEYGDVSYLLEQYLEPALLVIDDLGTKKPSDAFMDFLYIIVDKRYTQKNKCGTVITTNLNSKDMRLQFGDAFVSRVASGKCFRFEGEDRRFDDKYKDEK